MFTEVSIGDSLAFRGGATLSERQIRYAAPHLENIELMRVAAGPISGHD